MRKTEAGILREGLRVQVSEHHLNAGSLGDNGARAGGTTWQAPQANISWERGDIDCVALLLIALVPKRPVIV